jgi:hypothetical protein
MIREDLEVPGLSITKGSIAARTNENISFTIQWAREGPGIWEKLVREK